MAEAFLQVLNENLSSMIDGNIGLIMGVDNEMKKLSNTLTTIQNVLEDAEDRQLQSEEIQNWLSQLNGMAFEIEDILDDCNTELPQLKPRKCGNFNLMKFLFKYKIGRRMKDAVEKLDDIARDRHKFHLQETVVQQPNQVNWGRATESFDSEPDHIYGRDEDREKIVDILVNRVSEQSLSVLPIIGMGGTGKTTLAQLIYNDERVSQHFDTKLWICVSYDFDLKAILKAVIASATGERSNLENLDSLQHRLRQELNEKRYLLILDDVWNDNQEDWDILKGTLSCGSMGSSIVVTTRLQTVADITGTIPAHCLTELSEAQCWLLFKQRAFGTENEQLHGHLEAIGRRIVKKCRGVPLAAKALGGLLRFQRDEKEWIRVEGSHVWDLPLEENSILPVLRLSYRHLPFVLKRCFAYCSIFPKDCIFTKTNLVFHWMAHTCITSNGQQEVEVVGDQICNELILRSFLQVVDTRGGETTFKMHDVVHDLAQFIMENKVRGAKTESSRTSASDRRVREVRCGSKISPNLNIAVEVSKLSYIIKYNRLRMLKLYWATTEELPSAIGKLKELRCFTLIVSSIRTLPRTFCRLSKLQILVLKDCFELKSLPKKLRCMTNLRHIILEGCGRLTSPYKIGELTKLKTLSLFIVGDEKGNQLDELEHLDLGGRLEIKNLESVQNHLIAKKANLVEKPNLRVLVLRWKGDESYKPTKKTDDEKVLEALEPHPNLVTLEIQGFQGRELALWMKKMENLSWIFIRNCNCTHLSPLGDLPKLKSLHLSDLKALEYIVEENDIPCAKFPSLEALGLNDLPELKGWSKDEMAEMFPNLQRLGITSCELSKLIATSGGLTSVTKLELRNCKIESCFPEKLPSVEELTIFECMELANVTEEIKNLHRLQRLSIAYADDLISLPQGFQHIPSLQSLKLEGLPKLSSLPDWLPNLASLTDLDIQDCPAIPSLPSRMTNLKGLRIKGCRKLGKQCEKANGEDWDKISHIPRLDIDMKHRGLK